MAVKACGEDSGDTSVDAARKSACATRDTYLGFVLPAKLSLDAHTEPARGGQDLLRLFVLTPRAAQLLVADLTHSFLH